jgi:anti-sigma regulatory factor (Ser/Thr protein kinase)
MEAWIYELPPVLETIRTAATQFREWATARTCSSAVADCELALVEACNNLVIHNNTREPISLRADLNTAEVMLIIRDKTAGFDWPSDPKLPDAENEHGRGIFLIHALMTEVNYQRHNGRNELRLRRRF